MRNRRRLLSAHGTQPPAGWLPSYRCSFLSSLAHIPGFAAYVVVKDTRPSRPREGPITRGEIKCR